ncbi:DUF488 domain-containing protein [Pelagibacterium lacus]|uniref:DUF488 domain-containing protein n=1 Tax=Pelagibacterium lacus TaxID=2282655 RepID=A0A369W1L5_9HYPH|nr:DUF488 domain-containing protein [Pelagibacterium lacus]
MATFLTVGHSNRPLDELIGMLRDARIALLIDVRTFPQSRANPAFNIESLPNALANVQIGYRHCPALGGRRGKQPGVDEQTNAFWRVQSFHNYADYAMGKTFAAALRQLMKLGRDHRLALMCSEAVWWRCHRRIITDYLLMNGNEVDHLMSPGRCEPAKLTAGAVKASGGVITYPAA